MKRLYITLAIFFSVLLFTTNDASAQIARLPRVGKQLEEGWQLFRSTSLSGISIFNVKWYALGSGDKNFGNNQSGAGTARFCVQFDTNQKSITGKSIAGFADFAPNGQVIRSQLYELSY